jgi:hypothetical protein
MSDNKVLPSRVLKESLEVLMRCSGLFDKYGFDRSSLKVAIQKVEIRLDLALAHEGEINGLKREFEEKLERLKEKSKEDVKRARLEGKHEKMEYCGGCDKWFDPGCHKCGGDAYM